MGTEGFAVWGWLHWPLELERTIISGGGEGDWTNGVLLTSVM